MLMGMHGLFKAADRMDDRHDLPGRVRGGAENMRELVKQMGYAHKSAEKLLADPPAQSWT